MLCVAVCVCYIYLKRWYRLTVYSSSEHTRRF